MKLFSKKTALLVKLRAVPNKPLVGIVGFAGRSVEVRWSCRKPTDAHNPVCSPP